MDKPKCRLCGERHYGLCEGVVPSRGTPRADVKPTVTHSTTHTLAGSQLSLASKPGTRLPKSEKTVLDRALTPEHIPSRVTKTSPEVSVTPAPVSVTRKKGGRPKKDHAMTPAERKRRQRLLSRKNP